jgi:hypothetical protein
MPRPALFRGLRLTEVDTAGAAERDRERPSFFFLRVVPNIKFYVIVCSYVVLWGFFFCVGHDFAALPVESTGATR